MYENNTFETIMTSMLNYVSDRYPDLDTRTGSVIYTALAPIALELETAYHEMDMIIDETFLSTASKEYLVKHGDQIGVNLNEATYAHFEGEFDVDLKISTRFSLGSFNYNVISKLSDPTESDPYYRFELVCETSGSEPNGFLGDLTPITFIENISHAKLTKVLEYGEDEEETESYRYRLQIHVKQPPINGNVAQYEEWLSEYDGVGKYKVYPCWNGVNTVKLVILNPDGTKADDTLVEKVQKHFDPPTSTINDNVSDSSYPQGRGMGNGKAPIGSIVTVGTVTEVPVVINCTLILKEGYTKADDVQEAVKKYLSSIAMKKTTIGYLPISAEIYNAESVEDVTSLTITVNGIVMDKDASPFVDSVDIGTDSIGILDTEHSVWSV